MTPVVWNHGPIPVLEEALNEAKNTKDWFEAMLYSAIYLEKYGYLSIKNYLESLKVNPKLCKKILHRIKLRRINDYLLSVDIINKQEFDIIKTIAEERNKFVHRKEDRKYLIGTKASQLYEHLVMEAIRILKEKLNAVKLFAYKL